MKYSFQKNELDAKSSQESLNRQFTGNIRNKGTVFAEQKPGGRKVTQKSNPWLGGGVVGGNGHTYAHD